MSEFDFPSESKNPYAAPLATSHEPAELPSDEYDGQDFHPFKSIWFHPRKTIRRIAATDPTLHVTLLVCLAGIGEALDRASMRDAGEKVSVPVIFGTAVVLGPIGGLISLWIGSHLLRISGAWIGGMAPREHIKAAIAWASVPSIAALPLWIFSLLLMGNELFTVESPMFDARVDAEPLLWIPFIGIALIEMTLGIWGFVLLCNALAEVQGFRSAWAGFGNTILAGLLLIVPLMFVIFAVVFLAQR